MSISNIHDDMPNIDDLSNLEYNTVIIKFFEIYGRDKDPDEIVVFKTDRLNRNNIVVYCQFQNNSFTVSI